MTREPPDALATLRGLTPARVALGRTGASLPTSEILAFALDHARARDAARAVMDVEGVRRQVEAVGFASLAVESAAGDRVTFLGRPDLGRQLSESSRETLRGVAPAPFDVAFVLGDGLSSAAVERHAAPLLGEMRRHLGDAGWRAAPVCLATNARVALGDEIGEALKARLVIVLIGERPGLSSPHSLGAYVTFAPRRGRCDAERNCISNIRDGGLDPAAAAARLRWLVQAAFQARLTGVRLKDQSDLLLVAGPAGAAGRPIGER